MERSTKYALRWGFLALLWMGVARAQHLDILPQSPRLPPFQWFATTDKQHKNADYLLLKPGETRRVPLAAGILERLWSTSLFPAQTDLTLVAGPHRQQLLVSDGKAARGLLADKAFTFFPTVQKDSLARLEAGATLIVTNHAKTENKWFFQAAIRPTSPPFTAFPSAPLSRRLSKITLAPGEEKTIGNFDQPGEIIEFSVAATSGKPDFHGLKFKASFDGQSAVDASLLGMAGQVAGDGMIHNAVADFDGSRLILRWPMPFQSAQIALRNDGKENVNLDVGTSVRDYDKPPTPYRFCALESSAATQKGQPVPILDLKGEGAFVGLSLAIAPGTQTARRTFAYLEGNETLVADGKAFEGTGTEDFFSSAWYFPDKPFSHPFEGVTQKIAAPPAVGAYRLMIPDAMPFKKSFLFTFEHGNGNNTDGMEWKWASYWYQKPPLSLPQNGETVSASSPSPSDTASNTWKLAGALGVGVFLGVISARTRRRRTARQKARS